MEENIVAIAPVEFNKDNIAIILPKEVAAYLKIGPRSKNKTVFFSLTNQVVQLSAGKPILDIPLLNEENFDFAPAS